MGKQKHDTGHKKRLARTAAGGDSRGRKKGKGKGKGKKHQRG